MLFFVPEFQRNEHQSENQLHRNISFKFAQYIFSSLSREGVIKIEMAFFSSSIFRSRATSFRASFNAFASCKHLNHHCNFIVVMQSFGRSMTFLSCECGCLSFWEQTRFRFAWKTFIAIWIWLKHVEMLEIYETNTNFHSWHLSRWRFFLLRSFSHSLFLLYRIFSVFFLLRKGIFIVGIMLMSRTYELTAFVAFQEDNKKRTNTNTNKDRSNSSSNKEEQNTVQTSNNNSINNTLTNAKRIRTHKICWSEMNTKRLLSAQFWTCCYSVHMKKLLYFRRLISAER